MIIGSDPSSQLTKTYAVVIGMPWTYYFFYIYY